MSTPKPAVRTPNSRIIGLRLPLEIVREVKTEAARREMKLNDLFVELWEAYRKQSRQS